jgi:hypothetical protein
MTSSPYLSIPSYAPIQTLSSDSIIYFRRLARKPRELLQSYLFWATQAELRLHLGNVLLIRAYDSVSPRIGPQLNSIVYVGSRHRPLFH